MKIKRYGIAIFFVLVIIDLFISVLNYIVRGPESVTDILFYTAVIMSAFFITYYSLKFLDKLYKSPRLGFRVIFMVMGVFCAIVFGLDVIYDVRSLFHVSMPLSVALACLCGILDIKMSPKSDAASPPSAGR